MSKTEEDRARFALCSLSCRSTVLWPLRCWIPDSESIPLDRCPRVRSAVRIQESDAWLKVVYLPDVSDCFTLLFIWVLSLGKGEYLAPLVQFFLNSAMRVWSDIFLDVTRIWLLGKLTFWLSILWSLSRSRFDLIKFQFLGSLGFERNVYCPSTRT